MLLFLQDKLVEEVLLKDATVVETSAQNINHGFMVSYTSNSVVSTVQSVQCSAVQYLLLLFCTVLL